MIEIAKPEIDRIVLISDIHFGEHNALPEWVENMRKYFDDFFMNVLKCLIDGGHRPAVIIAGDFFESRKHIDINVLNNGMDVIENMAAVCPVFMVIGNHDIYTDSDRSLNSLRIFRHIENVRIVDDVATLLCANDRKILMVSWIGDAKEETRVINKYKKGMDIIVLHTEVSGMEYDNNRKIINGVSTVGISGKIYSGHIHKRQDGKKATYLGSPYEIHSKDACCTRGLYVLGMEKDDITETFIDNKFSPRYVKLAYADIKDDLAAFEDDIRNNYLTISVDAENSRKIDIVKFTEEIMRFSPRKLTCIEESAKIAVVESSEGTTAVMSDDARGLFANRVDSMDGLSDEERKDLKEMSDHYYNLAIEEMNK